MTIVFLCDMAASPGRKLRGAGELGEHWREQTGRGMLDQKGLIGKEAPFPIVEL